MMNGIIQKEETNMNKFLDTTPPVAAALKAGTPVAVLETGYFCSMAYPQNLQALRLAQQALWAKNCVPCCVAVINGRLKAGLTPQEEDALMRHRVVCSRGELPALAARGLSAAADPGAALAIAALADIVPVVIPGLGNELGDIEALAIYGRMAFSTNLGSDTLALLRSRSVPVMQEGAAVLADTWQIQRELEAPESTLCPAGDAMTTICSIAAETALELKKRTEFT